MRWAAPRPAGVPDTWTYDHISFHDLLDDGGYLLGYVREDKSAVSGFTPYTNKNYARARFSAQATLKEAKDMLVAHFVTQKLED